MDLLIVGVSARAAVHSALRAGLRPAAVDAFNDRDLAAVAHSSGIDIRDYPEGLVAAAGGFSDAPLAYTGGLENRPDLVERLADRHPLLGNDATTLRAVRDPHRMAAALRAAGLDAPEVRDDPTGLPVDGTWLRKPRASTGGLGIAPWVGVPGERTAGVASHDYYQRLVRGVAASAVYVGRRDAGARLAGVTRQLIGREGVPFGYRGSVGPWPVSPRARERIAAAGDVLARSFGLVGLFGVDFMVDGHRPWAVEVNPRYTASVEVIELATGQSLMGEHCDACVGNDSRISLWADFNRVVAKETLFAAGDATLDDQGTRLPDFEPFALPEVADLPRPGSRFAAGDPVLTVFALGDDPRSALMSLKEARGRWEGRLRGVQGPAVAPPAW